MEIIRRSTGGRIPRFWRPPYGDSDNRVRAIAQEVSQRGSSGYHPFCTTCSCFLS